MPIHWAPTPGAFRDFRPSKEDDFIALDDKEFVGRVMRIPSGLDEGKWMWTMTAVRLGPPFPHLRSGVERRPGEAGQRVLEAYKRLLFLTGRSRRRTGPYPLDPARLVGPSPEGP